MHYRIPVGLVLTATLFLAVGCVRLPLKKPVLAPQPLPERFAKILPRYAVPPVLFDETVLEVNESHKVVLRRIESFMPRWGTNKLLELECFLPYGASNAPVILLFPVSGGKSYPLERGFLAPYFAKRGYPTILVRRERISSKSMTDPKEIDSIISQSVFDSRRVIDWIATRSEFDTNRIGGVGTSLGSMKLCLLMATDSRVKAGVLALTGCDAPYIMTYSKDGAFRGGGVTMRRNRYMAANGLNHAQFYAQMKENITWDTKELGAFADPRKVLLILGACDYVVPFKKGLELRRVMHKPETEIVLSGHYSSAFYIFHIRASALEFLERKFNEK